MKKNGKEVRYLDLQQCQLRATEGDKPKITGYAAVFNQLSAAGAVAPGLLGFRERILPGAFKRTLTERKNIAALLHHNPEKVIGSTRAGTLTLAEDGVGLRAEIDPPGGPTGQDVVEWVRRGDLDGFSFAFLPPLPGNEQWHLEKGETVRDLLEIDLLEVSLTAFPVYEGTSAALRALLTEAAGIDHDALARVLVRAEKKLPLQPEDLTLLRGTIAALDKLIPTELRAQEVQTLIFDKEKFTEAEAKQWAADHDFNSGKVDETDSSFRLRQFDPEECAADSFQTLTENMAAGMKMVSCNRRAERAAAADSAPSAESPRASVERQPAAARSSRAQAKEAAGVDILRRQLEMKARSFSATQANAPRAHKTKEANRQ